MLKILIGDFMNLVRKAGFSLFVLAVLGIATGEAQGQEPKWHPKVIVRGEERAQIKSTPIELRPYRPLHFYGNTKRRKHYRGNPLPMPRDILRTGIFLIRR